MSKEEIRKEMIKNYKETIEILHRNIDDLQKVYDIALKEINKLTAKRKYWEDKFKKLENE